MLKSISINIVQTVFYSMSWNIHKIVITIAIILHHVSVGRINLDICLIAFNLISMYFTRMATFLTTLLFIFNLTVLIVCSILLSVTNT